MVNFIQKNYFDKMKKNYVLLFLFSGRAVQVSDSITTHVPTWVRLAWFFIILILSLFFLKGRSHHEFIVYMVVKDTNTVVIQKHSSETGHWHTGWNRHSSYASGKSGWGVEYRGDGGDTTVHGHTAEDSGLESTSKMPSGDFRWKPGCRTSGAAAAHSPPAGGGPPLRKALGHDESPQLTPASPRSFYTPRDTAPPGQVSTPQNTYRGASSGFRKKQPAAFCAINTAVRAS